MDLIWSCELSSCTTCSRIDKDSSGEPTVLGLVLSVAASVSICIFFEKQLPCAVRCFCADGRNP